MAVKKRRRTHRHKSDEEKRHHELSARLAPLEETKEFKRSEQRDNGREATDTIRVGSASVKMPEQLIAEDRDAAETFRLHPVVVAILVFALAFIAFVAWQITLMPPPAK
jgi:hypothetical protein